MNAAIRAAEANAQDWNLTVKVWHAALKDGDDGIAYFQDTLGNYPDYPDLIKHVNFTVKAIMGEFARFTSPTLRPFWIS